MTIETTSPAGAESLAALFDQLVEAVAQRVTVHLTGPAFQSAVQTAIENWADDYFDDRASTWAQVHLDINEDIDRYVRNELDIGYLVKDAVQDLSFEVTVS
jgi:hypothetical protein